MQFRGSQIAVAGTASGDWGTTPATVSCDLIRGVDQKVDDGRSASGFVIGGWGCEATASCNADWPVGGNGVLWYDAKF